MKKHIKIPANGQIISYDNNKKLVVPNFPIIPFIKGDGIGIDIMPVMQKVIDASIKKVYKDSKQIMWLEVYAGSEANDIYKDFLPDETLDALKKYIISIKGPLTTPVGKGMRSINVTIRQKLDSYVCLRPMQYFAGMPSPVKNPENVNMVVFRENSEDIYAGIEYLSESEKAKKIINFLINDMKVTKIRFPESSSIGIKPVSKQGTIRFIKKAFEYTVENDKPYFTIVHKGNIMKYTEGCFRNWAYQWIKNSYITKEYEGKPYFEVINPKTNKAIIVKDVIADAFLQEILLNPEKHSVIATLNLNGDYISDAIAAQIGGIGISPGANISDKVAVFEATHGSANEIAGLNIANPLAIILSAHMMLVHIGWNEAADLVIKAISKAIKNKIVTNDLAKVIGVDGISCSNFGDILVEFFND